MTIDPKEVLDIMTDDAKGNLMYFIGAVLFVFLVPIAGWVLGLIGFGVWLAIACMRSN